MKRSILLLLVLCCLLWAGPCSAQSYEVTEAELTRLETIFQKLESCNSELMKDLAALQTELELYMSEIAKARQDLAAAKSSLERANISLAQYEKEMKRKVRVVRQQRNVAWMVAGGLAAWGLGK